MKLQFQPAVVQNPLANRMPPVEVPKLSVFTELASVPPKRSTDTRPKLSTAKSSVEIGCAIPCRISASLKRDIQNFRARPGLVDKRRAAVGKHIKCECVSCSNARRSGAGDSALILEISNAGVGGSEASPKDDRC